MTNSINNNHLCFDSLPPSYARSDDEEMMALDEAHSTSSTDSDNEEKDSIRSMQELTDKIKQQFPEAAKKMLQPIDTSWTPQSSSSSASGQTSSSATPLISTTQVSPMKIKPDQHFKELGNLYNAEFDYVARKKQYYGAARDANLKDTCDQINKSQGQIPVVQEIRFEKAKKYYEHALDSDESSKAATEVLKSKSKYQREYY